MRGTGTRESDVRVAAGSVVLDGTLAVPANATGVVLFAHGSGSSRKSPRNRHVAATLQAAGLGTLLMDLLTRDEEAIDAVTREHRFDIALLASRLVGAVDWLGARPGTRGLRVGTFGSSTGGAAALVAAAERPEAVGAVVSRGGRPDLAGSALPLVRAPVLLVVGGRDDVVIDLNREAFAELRCEKRLEIVPAPRTSSRSPGSSTRSRGSRPGGSRGTSCGRRPPEV